MNSLPRIWWAFTDGCVVYGVTTYCYQMFTTFWVPIPDGACEEVASHLGLLVIIIIII